MILKNITIQNLGTVTQFSGSFTNGYNVLKDHRTAELLFAVRSVLNHKETPPPNLRVEASTKIDAELEVEGKRYFVHISPSPTLSKMDIQCHGEGGEDLSAEFKYLTSHPPEQDLSEVFSCNDRTLLRFLKYANDDLYYSPKELQKTTGGLSAIKAFRAYLRSFIKNFKPEKLRDGKEYEITLEKSGKYAVRYKKDGEVATSLSESEKMIFRYLCFLRTAEFWGGFEELRNMHSIKKPLLISGFLERLDESINTKQLLERTRKLKRQIILFTKNTERG